MALLIKPGREPVDAWIKAITAEIPDLEIRLWPEVGDRAGIEYILANDLPDGEFGTFPNLKFVAGTAVGVERLLRDESLPAHVPILRGANRERAMTMGAWVTYHVIRHHRRFDEYRANQAAKTWEQLKYAPPETVRVGVMGLGNLGAAAARYLAGFGYTVAGWARSKKDMPGIETFAGQDELDRLLARSDILVSILPNTEGTKGLLTRERLLTLPQGAYVINSGRGTLIDEDALLELIDGGHLSGAALDVFQTEPPPPEHPFWTHPRITMTAHHSCMGRASYGAEVIVDAIRKLRAGEPVTRVVDKAEGY